MNVKVQSTAENLLRLFRRDAVLLHRPYPPTQALHARSHFGGLPDLPESVEWPCTSSGTPLHFFAQVDCAEIGFATELPAAGLLLFFGRDDEEQIWGDNPRDDVRVLFVPDTASTSSRPAPDNLPPIGGGYFVRSAWYDFRATGQGGPNLHFQWPIVPRLMDSWPDASALYSRLAETSTWRRFLFGRRGEQAFNDETLACYDALLTERRQQAFLTATGRSQGPSSSDERTNEVRRASDIYAADAECANDLWPKHWLVIDYAAQAYLLRPKSYSGVNGPSEIDIAAAQDWRTRAAAADPTGEVPVEERRAFRTWMEGLRRPVTSTSPPVPTELVIKPTAQLVRRWAGDQRASLVSNRVFAALESELNGFTTFWGFQYSHLLGWERSTQEAQPVDASIRCLASLVSDYGIGFMFCDVGEATFWIDPENLKAGRFDDVSGTMQGG